MSSYIKLGNVSITENLGDYYFDFLPTTELIERGFYGSFDPNGIPLVDYDRLYAQNRISTESKNFGNHYTPVTICHYALGVYRRYNAIGKESDLRLFCSLSDWLSDNIVLNSSGGGVWLHNFLFPHYHLSPPWVSAMAQGEGISVLLRAFQLTRLEKYLEVALLAYKSYEIEIFQGGILYSQPSGSAWLEEIPTNPPSHILNGFVFSLLGIFDLYRCLQNYPYYEKFMLFNDTLVKNLHLYDSGYWSYYDLLNKKLSSKDYHTLHIIQMHVMWRLTQDNRYAYFERKWRNYTKGINKYFLKPILGKARNAFQKIVPSRTKFEGISIDLITKG